MEKKREYNGHPSWNAWNISLWIGNDEGIYRFAIECLERLDPRGNKPSIERATNRFMASYRGEKTPDGAIFTRTSVKHALKGLQS